MRRKHRKLRQEADLDITAFMNLMIVLVPILLINMIFAHTTVLELNFPDPQSNSSDEPDLTQLQVMIYDEQLIVADSKGGVIKKVDNQEGLHDFKLLSQVMQNLKSRVPEKKDIILMARKDTSYQTLVTVMDTVRSYKAVVAGSLVHAELFPEISIADAPELASLNEQGADNLASTVKDQQSQATISTHVDTNKVTAEGVES